MSRRRLSAVAVISKYAIRTRSANVFNPAAFALVSMMYVLPTGQSWWGALPEVSPRVAARGTARRRNLHRGPGE